MYLNESYLSLVLTLHSLELPEANIYPAFIFGIVAYLFILLCNLTIVITICLNRNLHKPMYILLLSLPINDALGATCLFPQLLYSIWSQDRSISYSACLLQGFFVHLYGGASYLILTAMAYDRLCQTLITDLVCYKATLLKLLCDGIEVNNIFGLCCIIFYHILALSVVAFTYIQILYTCVTNKQSYAKVKALQTCGTHLVVFVLLEFNTLFPILAHRSEIIPAFLRRVFSISNFIFPPLVNPLVYGFKTKEIRQNIFTCFKSKKISSF